MKNTSDAYGWNKLFLVS